MHFTEVKKIPGLLVLIDFEKAFDSISWSFIYKVLKFFGFGEYIIQWVKILNTNFKAAVLQSGFLSDQLCVERGCRQGDPVAPYLFLLCAEILSALIKENNDIKGILIHGKEHKISQYADDTSLILDGSPNSLFTAFDTLDFLDVDGNLLPHDIFQHRFYMNVCIMQYNSVVSAISRYLKSFLTKNSYQGFITPYIPIYYKSLLLHNKCTNVVYRQLNSCNVIPTSISKWESELVQYGANICVMMLLMYALKQPKTLSYNGYNLDYFREFYL